jgi:hypothetical protein
MRGRFVALVVGSALWLTVGPVGAQTVDNATRGAARTLGNEGVKAYQSGDYASADRKLDKAYRVLQAPSLGLWSARALVKLGRLVEATERYLEVTRLGSVGGDEAVQKQAQADAQAELEALTPRVPSIVIELVGAAPGETTVSIDGVELKAELVGERRPTEPGKHTVVGRRGTEQAQAEVVLAEGDQKSVQLVFTAPADASAGASSSIAVGPADSPAADRGTKPSSTQRVIGWITVGAGGAGLAIGTTFGVLAMSKRSELEDSGSCRGDRCLSSVNDDLNTLRMQRTVSTIGFAAGGVLAVTGIVLVLTAPKVTSGLAVRVGPSGVSFEQAFQ